MICRAVGLPSQLCSLVADELCDTCCKVLICNAKTIAQPLILIIPCILDPLSTPDIVLARHATMKREEVEYPYEPRVPGLPRLTWLNGRSEGVASYADGELTIRSRAKTDWFNDPRGVTRVGNAPVLSFALDGDFALSTRATGSFDRVFDAAVILLHQGPDDYAKLCLERAPDGSFCVVSVVTSGTSDDCTGPVIRYGETARLRVSRKGNVIAFHYANKKDMSWHLVRLFRFRNPTRLTTIGFCSQSPVGKGSASRFDRIQFQTGPQLDPRSVIEVNRGNIDVPKTL